ncbi:hypothetical protein M413DRAFT_439021 [Hebeloma cylindrosporum]|uniref:Uncharacterized protein n=1 Tax=Hebeloma cylindrosporum TaxID=76867 RepID=A0A0C3D0E3_HEBCY|nr:hypothetical protein M413DRAFT_439021 [Hebeloma cylindrosporum h7]
MICPSLCIHPWSLTFLNWLDELRFSVGVALESKRCFRYCSTNSPESASSTFLRSQVLFVFLRQRLDATSKPSTPL